MQFFFPFAMESGDCLFSEGHILVGTEQSALPHVPSPLAPNKGTNLTGVSNKED